MSSHTPAPSGKRGEHGDGFAVLVIAALALAALVAIPTALGAVIWLLARRWFSRREFAVLAVASLAAFALDAAGDVRSYMNWFLTILHLHQGTWWHLPWLALATWSLTVAGLVGMAEGTFLTRKLPTVLGRKNTLGKQESLLPTDRELAAIASIATPATATIISADQHSVAGSSQPGDRSFPLGVDRRGTPALLSEKEVGTHGLILGSTGSGKTETIKTFMGALLDLGWSGTMLDLKEDTKPGGLRDFCYEYTLHHRLPYQELRLTDTAPEYWFNPLYGMGPDEARDTILSLNEFDDSYWQAINKKTLGQLVNLLYYAHQIDPVQFPAPTMYEIGRILGAASLVSATKAARALVKMHMPHVNIDDDFAVLTRPAADEQKSAAGFGAKLTQMYDTQAGRTVLRGGAERRVLDVTQDGLTYIGLDTLGKADLTKVISSAVLQRMSVYAAQRTTGQTKGQIKPRFLIVDEANWLDRTITMNLLSRARSAGIVVFLATQGPRDWIDERGDDFGRMVQNCMVQIFMKQNDPVSAEMCAEVIGKTEQLSISHRVMDGELMDAGSTRMEEVFRVKPEEVRNLGVGQAFIRIAPTSRLLWAKINMRDPRLTAYR